MSNRIGVPTLREDTVQTSWRVGSIEGLLCTSGLLDGTLRASAHALLIVSWPFASNFPAVSTCRRSLPYPYLLRYRLVNYELYSYATPLVMLVSLLPCKLDLCVYVCMCVCKRGVFPRSAPFIVVQDNYYKRS